MSLSHHASAHSSARHALIDRLLSRLSWRPARRHGNRNGPPQRKKILFETLEPRMLLSADLLPGTAQQPANVPPPVDVQVTPPLTSPQINWTAQQAGNETPLYADALTSSFDLDNFSSPLTPVKPAGGLLYAGGVQGTLDFDGDSDTMAITLDGGQKFSLRLSPDAGLQVQVEAFDPDGVSLGQLSAANPGDSLILQSRSAADGGEYSIVATSLLGAGGYTVEILLNGALDEDNNADADNAQDLDDSFSELLDSGALRGAVVGELAGLVPAQLLAEEDFEDVDAFFDRVNAGIWDLQSNNPDAYVSHTSSGEGEENYLSLGADESYDYSEEQIDDGEGGTYTQSHYTYDASLTQATWHVNLAGVTRAMLQFDQRGHDPNSDDGYGGGFGAASFTGDENRDGVALSVDGENWTMLQYFEPVYYSDWGSYAIDLVQAAEQEGMTLGANTRVRFQMYDPGGTLDSERDTYYRNLDNVRITTDQQTILLPAVASSPGQQDVDYSNPIDLLTDGQVPIEQSDFVNNAVYWFGQEVGEPDTANLASAAVEDGLYFDLDLDSVQRVTDIVLSVDNNDDYALDYSLDGENWFRLLTVDRYYGESDYGMDTFSTDAASAEYEESIDFAPVQARYLRAYATGGDGNYSIGEIQAFSEAAVQQEDWYSLSLDAGEVATFTLTWQNQIGPDAMLELYDPARHLLTFVNFSTNQSKVAIENFLAASSGTYLLRVSGNVSDTYSLVAVRQAQFGPATGAVQNLTLTPVALDALSEVPEVIRVAVAGGSYLVNQLNNDSFYDFQAQYVDYFQIDTLEELANFDVVVLGNYFDTNQSGQFAPALRQWVEDGHGLVSTGWSLYYGSLQYGNVNTDLDAIVPINLNTYSSYTYSGYGNIAIAGTSHPVIEGISDFSSPYYYDYLIFGQNGVDAEASVLATFNGMPAVTVASAGRGRTVALAPDYASGNSWYSGMADRLLEQAVAWSAERANSYTIDALAGTDLTITLDLLGSDAGEPTNTLLPEIEILDSNGQLLASGSTTASYAVTEDARFTIKVKGTGLGDYLLRASGDFPSLAQELQVTGSSLTDQSVLTGFPGYVDLSFSAPILLTSLAASDLEVNGVAADSYQVLTPSQIRFLFSSAFSGDGGYALALADGVVTDIHGNASVGWQLDFELDTHGPQVTATSVAPGSMLGYGVQTLDFTFNEPLNAAALTLQSMQLQETLGGQALPISSFSYDDQTQTLSITTPSLGEGNYTLTLLASSAGFTDPWGNVFDGDANGSNGGNYAFGFGVDLDTLPYPPMLAMPPLGSLVYDPVIAGVIHATGDLDNYTVSLDPDQLLTVVADVRDAALALDVTVVQVSDGSTVAHALGTAGNGVVLQGLTGLSGDYRVEVRGASGQGRYEFALILGALFEAESLRGGSANNTDSAAMDLAAGTQLLGANGANHLAVLGERSTNGAIDDDYYAVQFTAGQASSIALAWTDGASGDLQLELRAPDGSLLLLGGSDAGNAQRSIREFIAPSSGNYLLRVSGAAAGSYNLVVTRGLALSLPSTIPGVDTQDISATGQVLGYSSVTGVTGSSGDATPTNLGVTLFDASGYRWDIQSSGYIGDGTSDAYDGGMRNTQMGNFSTGLLEEGGREVVIGTTSIGDLRLSRKIYVPSDQSYARFLEIVTNTGSASANFTVPIFTNLGSDDGERFIQTSSGDAVATVDDNWVITDDSFANTSGGDPVVTHVVAGDGGRVRPTSFARNGDDINYGYNLSLAPGETQIIMHFASQAGNQATALARAPLLEAAGLGALRGMSSAERASVMNFNAGGGNVFTVQVSAGDTLDIATTTPGDGPNEPGNTLDPAIELLDPSGNVVASDTSSAADGRNAHLVHTALAGGSYTVRVLTQAGQGAFLLQVSGATAVQPEFTVSGASISQDQVLASAPATVDIHFSSPVLVGSIGAADLTVNGQAASGVLQIDADTLRFTVGGLIGTDGLYTLDIQADALEGSNGAGVSAFSRGFTLDTTGPTVTASSVAAGESVPTGARTLVFTLNEDIATSGLGVEDALLTNTTTGQTFAASTLVFDAASNQLTVQYANLTEGAYSFTLRSGASAVRDLVGNALNGNTATPEPDDYQLLFGVDDPDAALPAFTALAPAGSLIYSAQVTGRAVHGTGDADIFTVQLDAGQTLTLWATPTAGSPRLAIELFDAAIGGNSLGLAEASTDGQTVLLQTVAAGGGTVRIEVRSIAGAGAYSLQALLNAALETELVAGAANDTRATAQDLAASFIATGSDRGAVVGESSTGADDWYAVELQAGMRATFALKQLTLQATNNLWLGLYDGAGTLLTAGSDVASNVDEVIADFAATGTGTYYLRVTGDSQGRYSLVATRDQSFGLEMGETPQDIGPTGEVLGALGGSSGSSNTIRVAVLNAGNAGQVVSQLNDNSYFNFSALSVGTAQIDTLQELASYDVVMIGDSVTSRAGLQTIAPVLRQWVEAGGGIVGTGWTVYLAGSSTGTPITDINAIVPVDTTPYYNYQFNPLIDIGTTDHPITVGVADFYPGTYAEYSPTVDAGAQVLAMAGSQAAVVAGTAGGGRSVYLGPLYMVSGSSSLASGAADRLLEQAVAWAAGDSRDDYAIHVNAGDALVVSSQTPGDGAGEPANALDVRLELYDETGTLVASDDNSAADGRNALLNHVAASAGIYEVRVIKQGSGGGGAYVLRVEGATGSGNPAPQVIASSPLDGQRLTTAPTSISFDLSEGILASSLEVGDLTIDSGAVVTAVEMVDGDTVRFLLQLPTGEANYQYSLAADAFTDLQGTGSAAHAGSFLVDFTPPRVVSQNPEVQSVSPFTTWSVTFNEALDPSSVQASDFVLRNPSNGIIGINSATLSEDRTTVTLTFSGQYTQGNYTLTVGTNLQDSAGNLMDQDSVTAGLQQYLGTVQVASPDLQPMSIQITLPDGSPLPEGGVELGSLVKIVWTVQNVGTDAARASSWYDSLWISSAASTVNATHLGSFQIDADPTNATGLPAGGQYTMSATVRLPLSDSWNAGNFYFRVQVDSYAGYYSYQPENNENNNALYSAVVPAVVPPLPDLTVSDVVAPAVVEANKAFTVSWIVHNQGTASTNSTSGGWYDHIVMSSDLVYGNADDVLLTDNWSTDAIAAGGQVARSATVTLPTGHTGNWNVMVWTDYYNYVYERGNEGNNVATSAQQMQVIVPTEDLVPLTLEAPDSALFNGLIDVSWTVANNGTGPTYGNWYDQLFLSTDTVRSQDDIALAHVYASNSPDVRPLEAGAQYTRTIQGIRLPLNVNLAEGRYYLLLAADAGGQEPEQNDGNNLLARAIDLTLADYADLTVSNVQVPGDTVNSGSPVNVQFTLTNQGEATATNFHNYLFLSSNGSSRNIYVGDYFYNQSLAVGESVTVEKAITVPLYQPGNWYLIVDTDTENNIYEHAHENNNSAVSSTPITSVLPPLPDLVVSDITVPQQALAGAAITLSWTITNQGTADFTGSWNDRVFLSANGGISVSQDFGYFTFEGTLAAGASVTRTQNLGLSPTQDGIRRLVVVTDVSGQVNETPSGQTNNFAIDDGSIDISFPPLPNLQVTVLTPPADPASGTHTSISWTVTNSGVGATSAPQWYDEARLSLNTVWGDADDIVLGTVLNPNYLPAGESYAQTRTIAFPNGLSGEYYFLVKTDIYNQVFENQDEGDNVAVSPLTFIALTPPPDLRVDNVEAQNLAFSGQTMSVSWTVSNHGQGSTVATTWYDRVIMSADDVLGNADDRNMGDFVHQGSLDEQDGDNDSYTVSRTISLPIAVIGDFHFFVVTDSFGQVYEHGSETNNWGTDMLPDETAPETTTILLTPPPDLEVLSVTAPANAQAGHNYNVSWRVANFGATGTPNGVWTDRVYLSSDSVLDAGDIVLGSRQHNGALGLFTEDGDGNPTGGYYDSSLNVVLPFNISGSYRLIVKTDADSQVFEGFVDPEAPDGDDNNTRASAAMNVVSLPADLVITSLASPSTGEAGKQIAVSWTVRNDGTGDTVTNRWLEQIRLSADDILFDADDVVLGDFVHGGLLGVGASYDRTETVTLPFSLTGGSYRLYVLTDYANYVNESDDSNNSAHATIQVVRDTPDLQVASVTPATSGMVGLPLQLSWHVDNLGANQTNVFNWYDQVYLSRDQLLDNGDVSLGNYYRNAPVAAGAGYDASASYNLPNWLAPDDYYVIVRTDINNGVIEGDVGELNNLGVSVAQVSVAAYDSNNPLGIRPLDLLRPNLKVTAVTAPQDAVSGQIMQVSWTVTNDGADPTGNRAWYDAVYLSRDGVLDRNADFYLGYAYASNLDAGTSYSQTLDVRVPYGQSGPFYVFVASDSGRYLPEVNRFDNVRQSDMFTQVALAPPADLVLGTITVPANGIPGQQATIGFSVQNQGTNPALGSWTDSVYLSADDTWDIGDALFGTVTHYGDVAGGTSYSSSLTAVLPGVTPGNYHVIVRSDIRNHIPESNENNNIGGSLDSVALDVEALTLGVADTGELGSGQSIYYKFDVEAGETVRLTLDSAGDTNANEIYVRYGNMPTPGQFDVAAREGFESDPQLLIPTTQAGTYYVLAYGRAVSGGTAYSIKAEIIPFSVTDVHAKEIGNSGDVTLRIDGARFAADTVFSLVGPDGSTIEAHVVQLANTSEAYATFRLLGAVLGAYDVVATQADGTSVSKLDALTVQEDFGAEVFLSIAGPTAIGVGRSAIFTIEYVNDGGADTYAPLMVLESQSGTPLGFSASDLHTTPIHILAASFDGPMDVLRPGARYSVPIVFQASNAAGPMDIRVGRILADDTRLIEDWTAIEASIRPNSIPAQDWAEFWGRIKPLIGLTWGEYVQLLDMMMLQVSDPGHPIRDVREIFARMFQQNPDFVPYASMGGEVRDSESDLGLEDVQMAAYLVHPDGRMEFKASAISDADGHYEFARLMPGLYKVVAIGRALDMDRNGQLDLTAPQFTLGETAPGDAGIIYVQPLAGIGSSNDSNPALSRDSNGITHMVWSRDGAVWHAWYDTTSGQWRDAQALSEGDSYGPAIASSAKLFDSATAGTIVAWQQGKGNDAEIWYAVARAASGGGFEWSAPVQLTDDDTLDAAAQIVVGDNGLVMITHLKRDGEIQDDTDVYYDIFALSASDFVWPAALVTIDTSHAGMDEDADAPLNTEGVSVAYGRQWKFGPWDFFGTEAEIVLALSGQVGENNCVATLGAQGQISGSFKGSSIRSTITGNGNVSAEWGVNEAARDWMFNGAKAGWGASAQFDWRYGLSTLLSKIPHPAATSAYLAYSLGVALAARFGLTFEDGITFGGGASFSGMQWTFTQPFPDFVWPESIAEASINGMLGVYAQLDVGPTGDSARLQGDITVTVDIAPEVRLKSITGNITFSGNIGWFTFNEVFSIDFYSAGALEASDAPLQTQDASDPVFDAAALFGTGNSYGSKHVLADVSGDLLIDSAMSMANDAGTLFGTWTHMEDPTVSIGSQVMVASYAGSTWSSPGAIAGSMGLNSFATAAVDAQGRRMVLWTHADASSMGSTPTIEQYEAALDGNEVVFALYDENTGSWGTVSNVAATSGMDSALAITHDAAGNLVLSWLVRESDTMTHLMTSSWNGSAWSAATEIASGGSVMDPAMERLGDDLIVVWGQDGDPSPDKTDSALYYSIYDGAAWSAGAMFDPIAMATGLALSAGNPVPTTADTSLTTESGFPPFPVPEECLKCKPEEIKRIRESAPTCRDGGGTQVTFDPKTCTEKTIVYQPCAVRPRDPNDIIGPEGYADEHWVAVKDTLDYMIRFENAADATAPAQQVVITQQLDSDLDWRTFRVNDFGFGDQVIEIDANSAFYQTRLDYTADPARGYFVDVAAAIDTTTGIVTWTLTTIDPATGEPPIDASIGFLPVNDTVYDEDHNVVGERGTGRGEGYVTYTVKAKRDAETGTVVDAQARIVFDTEEPIDTPAIANTLDAGKPSSAVIAFDTGTSTESAFLVQWGGEDDEGGSGVRDFTIYVSVDDGEYGAWLFNTELTEAVYTGAAGHTYKFYSTARDNAGNEEAAASDADATMSVGGGTGSISGTQFDDFDGDGVRDEGEDGLAGWLIYIDADDNGSFDDGELATESDANGNYLFGDLVAGSYLVRAVQQDGWTQTLIGNAGEPVSVLADQNVTGIDFGSFANAQIGGQVFDDADADGTLDAAETGLSGWLITLDAGDDGSIDATTTSDEYGFYRFTNLGPGSYRIGQTLATGWLLTSPIGGSHLASPTSGEDIGSQDFAVVQAASISGTKFEDVDGDGERDAGEAGLGGWTIFLDGNGNGMLDGGERSTVTAADGSYRFDDLLPGNYAVGEVMQDGWMQTTPGASAGSLGNASVTLSGEPVVLSLPEDMVFEQSLSTEGLTANDMAEALIGLDQLRDDPLLGRYDGSGVRTVVIDTGIDLNHNWFGPDADGNGVADRIVYSWDFADNDANAGDRNGHGSHVASLIGSQDAQYGGVAPGADLIVLKVFSDGGLGYFSYLEQALQWVVANADDYGVGVVNLSLGDSGNWNTAIGRYGLGDELAALSGQSILITAAAGNNFFQFGSDMGVAYPAADPAVLAVGAVWSGSFGGPVNYANGAVDYGTGADQIAAFSQRDGELLDVLAPGTRLVGANYNGGTRTLFGTSQASAYMAGVATLAQDIALDRLGRRLDMAEFRQLLQDTSVWVQDGDDEYDNVDNTGLSFARVDLPALALAITGLQGDDGTGSGDGSGGDGQTQVLAGSGMHQVTLVADEHRTDVDFGNFALGSISGNVFHDGNANQFSDALDYALENWTVFLDGNGNGQLDAGEQTAGSDASGNYRFDDLGPGSYSVVLLAQDGWTSTTSAVVAITMTSALDADADFGLNARPTLDEVADAQVDEGSTVQLNLVAHDDTGDSTMYSLVGATHGASMDAATGLWQWTPADGDASASFTVRATDLAGGYVEQTFTVTVDNVAPTLALDAPASVTDDQDYTLALSATDPGTDTITGWQVHWGDGSSSMLDAAAGALTHRYATPGSYAVSVTATDEDGDYQAESAVTVHAGTLKVTSLETTATGIHLRFNQALAADQLNLYDSGLYQRGAADLRLTNALGRPVVGSMVLDGDGMGLTFIRTNGLMAAGTYSLALDSRANGFAASTGGLLDGNRDGTAGDGYLTSFTVASSGATLAIGEFTRGPGQAADPTATTAGIPITISGAAGARAIAFTLGYDASLLDIASVVGAAGIPAGSTVTADFGTPGQVRISLTLAAPLGAGTVELVRLLADVPATAGYGAKHLLDLRDITLDTGASVRDDDGLHLVAYVGDASGNAKYSTLDVQRIQRTVLRMDSGFGAYPMVDPAVVADINGNRLLTVLDAQRVLSEVMGIDRPEIPPIPAGMTLTFGGPDPVIAVGQIQARAGDTVTVPITLDTAAGLESVELELLYPADQLELLEVRLGNLTGDFDYVVKDTQTPGRVRIDVSRMQALSGGNGNLFELVFRVGADAHGELPIDLIASALNETWLTLHDESRPGLDPTDGMVVIMPPPPAPVPAPAPMATGPVPESPPVASAPQAAPASPAASTPAPADAAPAPTPATATSTAVPALPAPFVLDATPTPGAAAFTPVAVAFDGAPAAAAATTPAVAAPAQAAPTIRFGEQPGRFALDTLAQKAWVGDWLGASRENSSITRKLNNWKLSLGSIKGISRL